MQTNQLEMAASKVITELDKQNRELGWILSSTRFVEGYEGQVELREELQARMDHAIGGMSIVYLFALLETYIGREYWDTVNESMKDKIYAYYHIRNTMAHGFDGKRAERYVDEFDRVMNSENPIRGVVDYDNNTIIVDASIWIGLKDFLRSFVAAVVNSRDLE